MLIKVSKYVGIRYYLPKTAGLQLLWAALIRSVHAEAIEEAIGGASVTMMIMMMMVFGCLGGVGGIRGVRIRRSLIYGDVFQV